MPDKTRERFYLDQLRACLPDLPGGIPLEPEPPDFILAPGVADLGIVRIPASIDGRDQLWHATFNGWVAPIAPEHVQAEINRKAHVVQKVKDCKEVWLVLVQDIFSGGAPSELSEEAGHHEYQSDFARVIWLEPHAPRVRALRLSKQPDKGLQGTRRCP